MQEKWWCCAGDMHLHMHSHACRNHASTKFGNIGTFWDPGGQGTMTRSGPDEATLAAITAALSPAGTTAGNAAAAQRTLEARLLMIAEPAFGISASL